MSMPVLAHVRRSAARAMNETFSEHWTAARYEELAREALDALTEFKDLSERVENYKRTCYRQLLTAAEEHRSFDFQGRGESLREMYDSALDVLEMLRLWVRRISDSGYAPAGATDLEEQIRLLERERDQTLTRWPWPPTAEEVSQAVTEYERGESLPLDEAFAEIAGVSKQEWLARVERRRRELVTERGES